MRGAWGAAARIVRAPPPPPPWGPARGEWEGGGGRLGTYIGKEKRRNTRQSYNTKQKQQILVIVSVTNLVHVRVRGERRPGCNCLSRLLGVYIDMHNRPYLIDNVCFCETKPLRNKSKQQKACGKPETPEVGLGGTKIYENDNTSV